MAPDCGNIIAVPLAVHGRVSQTVAFKVDGDDLAPRREETSDLRHGSESLPARRTMGSSSPKDSTHGKCPSADRAHAHPTSRPKLEYRVGPISGLYLVLDSVEFERSPL